MMKFFMIIPSILFLSCCCDSYDLWCYNIDQNATAHEIYCLNNRQKPKNCSNLILNKSSVDGVLNATDVAYLKMSACHFQLVINTLTLYTHLDALDISYSGYKSLNSFIVRHKHLVKLNGSHNELEYIPRQFFSDTPAIREIDFSNNKLKSIETICFVGAANVTHIYLSHNQIADIDEHAFGILNNLEFIDLGDNLIAEFSFAFAKNTNLKTLHFKNNQIERFKCNLFSRVMNTTAVSVSWKYVKEMDTSCLEGILQIILNSSFQAILPVPIKTSSTRMKIQLHCNETSFENIRIFKVGRYVKNALEVIEYLGGSVEELDLAGNNLGNQLETSTFQSFIHLKRLYLSDTKLTSFDFDIIGQQRQLEQLDISHNQFIIIQNASFLAKLPLWYFNIANNHLKNTLEIVQHLNSSVAILDVSGNDVGLLNASVFEKFNNLYWLSLKDSNLLNTDLSPFEPLKVLYYLDISQNNLEMFNFSLISTNLTSLQEFYAVNCHIKNPIELQNLFNSSLYILDLSGNFIGEVNASIFKESQLETLNLSHTNLSKFDFDTLEHQTKLRSLNISHNNLKKVNLTFLSSRLLKLNLEGNDLTEIDTLRPSRFPLLSSLAIAQNQFSCDYLEAFLLHVERKWTYLKIFGDPLDQKHGEDCRSIQIPDKIIPTTEQTTRAIIHIQRKIYETTHIPWFMYTITIMSLIVAVALSTFNCYVFRERLFRRNVANRRTEPRVIFTIE